MGSAHLHSQVLCQRHKGFCELEVRSSSPPPSLGEGGVGFFELNQVLLTAGQRQERASSLQALSFPCMGKPTMSTVNASPRAVSCSRTSLRNQLTSRTAIRAVRDKQINSSLDTL